ncbi:hypothetical protein [Rickettsia endosymbiont of Cantharis rufa]|uniref:hypothetical protein n=1 Tax=Rickettsia endosymbiont of Cantharis rufa TaxID=3066248 RepID=UPI0031329E7E
MTNKRKEYVDQNVLPEPQEVMKEFALNKGEMNLYIKQIEDLMMTNQSTNNQNTHQNLSSKIKTFGRERDTKQQSSDDIQDAQNSNNTNQTSSRKIFDTAQNVNNSKNTGDTTKKTSRTPMMQL